MQKLIVYIVSSLILFQSFNLDLGDFKKIPTLVNHAVFHFESGDSLSNFFESHYGSQTLNHQNDHKEHNKLPFKNKHPELHFPVDFIQCVQNYAVEVAAFTKNGNNFYYKEPSTNFLNNNHFQPPQKLHS